MTSKYINNPPCLTGQAEGVVAVGVCDEELGDAGRADLRPLHLHLFFFGVCVVWYGGGGVL